ncbi:hypothetical protein THOB06_230067 [Vibrio rotiferianus]|nr:hypothetical protein THOG10_230068 [Vibrio rotiferianus]CAH1577390.1 hypothetical protein THOB06_230067 [Vibrio rotiferianus]
MSLSFFNSDYRFTLTDKHDADWSVTQGALYNAYSQAYSCYRFWPTTHGL